MKFFFIVFVFLAGMFISSAHAYDLKDMAEDIQEVSSSVKAFAEIREIEEKIFRATSTIVATCSDALLAETLIKVSREARSYNARSIAHLHQLLFKEKAANVFLSIMSRAYELLSSLQDQPATQPDVTNLLQAIEPLVRDIAGPVHCNMTAEYWLGIREALHKPGPGTSELPEQLAELEKLLSDTFRKLKTRIESGDVELVSNRDLLLAQLADNLRGSDLVLVELDKLRRLREDNTEETGSFSETGDYAQGSWFIPGRSHIISTTSIPRPPRRLGTTTK